MKQQMMNSTILTNETGRSMVEMLGVLAIVGVLSVGGVYGYGVAMKKHKANELLHKASMLATTISAQAMTNDGKLPETITDFGNSGYDTDLTDNGTKFILTMKDVDSAVCNQLKTGGMVQKVECKAGTSDGKMNAEITYYKNLATNPAEGEKSPTGGNNTSACVENESKCTGGTYYVCENGKWVSKTTPSGLTCNGDELGLSDSCSDNQEICYDDKAYMCCGGEWQNNYSYCCDGDTIVAGGGNKCENGTLFFCCGGEWLSETENSPMCEGNTYLGCNYGEKKCENDVFYSCCGDEWEITENSPMCDGDTYLGCDDGEEKCENDVFYSCCGGTWQNHADYCCDGKNIVESFSKKCKNDTLFFCCFGEWLRYTENSPLCDGDTYLSCNDDGEKKCMNGTYYTCCAGEWYESYGCCLGDTAFKDHEGYCKDGVYYMCSGAWWANSNDNYVDHCCNGDDIVEEGGTTTINGKTYRCQSGQLWLYETCNVDGATKCMDGKYYTCCAGEWMNYGGCCYGDTAFEDWTYQCIAGKYRECCTGTWIEYGDCQTAGSCSTEGATSCINGTYYTCYGGVWNDTSDKGCCDGDIFVPNWENRCINGVYKYCCTGIWSDTGNICPTGEDDICSANCITDANECQKLKNLYELSTIEGPIGLQDLDTDTFERIEQCHSLDQDYTGHYICSAILNRASYSATCSICLAECYTGLRSDITGRCIDPTEQGYFYINEGRESECEKEGWHVIRPYEMPGSYCSSSYELTEMLDGSCP